MKPIRGKPGFFEEFLGQGIFACILFMLLLCAAISTGQEGVVSGCSMEDAFQEGDSLFINKLPYYFTKPKRFDAVVFPLEEEEGDVLCLKRIIGLPGETVQIAGDMIYIDGKMLKEDYGKEAMEEGTAGIAASPVMLGEDEYFVLGDNRNASIDSRQAQVGPIKGERIIGRAEVRLWPWR